MEDIINAILALPDLTLSKRDYIFFANILRSLDDESRNIKGFTYALANLTDEKGEIDLDSTNIHAIIHYLNEWFIVGDLIVEKNLIFADRWLQLTNEKMPNDALLPLLIELLPDDVPLLEKVNAKLEPLMNLFTIGSIAYTVLNLYSAITAKKNPGMKSNNENEKNLPIIRMILAEHEIIKLQ